MNYLLFIYPLFFGYLFFKIRQKKTNPSYTIIVILYLLASLSAIYIYDKIGFQENINLDLIAICYHVVAMFLLIFPFKDFDAFRVRKMHNCNADFLFFITVVVIACTLVHIFLSVQEIDFQLLLNDAKELRALIEEGSTIKDRYLFTVDRMGQVLSGTAMALMFYFAIKKPTQKFLIALLFLCSCASIVSGMRVGAREYYVKFAFEYVMLYILFHNKINSSWKSSLKRVGIVMGAFFASLFIIITIARFTLSVNYGNPFDSLFGYLGQGMLFFSGNYLDFGDGVAGGSICYPAIVGSSFSRIGLNDTIISDRALNTFSTTVGSWVFDMGTIVAFIICIGYFFLFKYFGRRKLNVYTLIYLVWSYEFIFSTVFFFNSVLDIQRLACYVMVAILDVLDRKGTNTLSAKVK